MIPVRTLRNDILVALCAVIIGSAIFLSLPHTHAVTSNPLTSSVSDSHTDTAVTSTHASTTNATTSDKTGVEKKNTSTTKISKRVSTKTSPQQFAHVLKTVTDSEYKTLLTQLIYDDTNEFRKNHQRKTLTTDTALSHQATTYSATMLTQNFLSHTDAQGCDMTCRFTRDGYTAQAWGENLAVLAFDERPTPEYVANYFMNAWEKSADHLANLMNPAYTNTGIGIAMNGNSIYATVQFAKPQ